MILCDADGVTVILPLLDTDTVEVAELDSRLPDPGGAHAIIETRKRDSLLATYSGQVARRELPDDAVLDLA